MFWREGRLGRLLRSIEGSDEEQWMDIYGIEHDRIPRQVSVVLVAHLSITDCRISISKHVRLKVS
jgi:hypothetical protein